MKSFRLHSSLHLLLLIWCVLFSAAASAQEPFVLNLSRTTPGTAELSFTREAGYYYRLEESPNLLTGFSAASAWMLGDDSLAAWSIQYSVGSAPGGSGGTTAGSDTFDLYPFSNGKTLITWTDSTETRYRAIVAQDYLSLPPLLLVPGTETSVRLFLLVGHVA